MFNSPGGIGGPNPLYPNTPLPAVRTVAPTPTGVPQFGGVAGDVFTPSIDYTQPAPTFTSPFASLISKIGNTDPSQLIGNGPDQVSQGTADGVGIFNLLGSIF